MIPNLDEKPPFVSLMTKLGLEPDPWQAEVLEGKHQRLLLNFGRLAVGHAFPLFGSGRQRVRRLDEQASANPLELETALIARRRRHIDEPKVLFGGEPFESGRLEARRYHGLDKQLRHLFGGRGVHPPVEGHHRPEG